VEGVGWWCEVEEAVIWKECGLMAALCEELEKSVAPC
jgi:hypothetical protein